MNICDSVKLLSDPRTILSPTEIGGPGGAAPVRGTFKLDEFFSFFKNLEYFENRN